MKHLGFSSLCFRLLLLVLVALVPTSGLMFYTAAAQRRWAAAEIPTQAQRLTQLVAIEEEQLIATTRELLIAIAHLPEVRSQDPNSCRDVMGELMQHYRRYVNMGLIAPDGNVLCSVLPLSKPVGAADRAYFQRALQTRDFAVGDYQTGRITGVPSINFSYPALDEAKQVRAVVFAAVGLDWLNRTESEVAATLPKGSRLTKIDSKGIILVHHPDSEKWLGQPLPETSLARSVLSKDTGIIRAPDANGIRTIHGFAKLQSPVHGGNVHVILSVPEHAVFARANRRLVFNLASLGIVAVLTLAAGWIGGDVLVLRRIKTLVSMSERLAGGDVTARSGLPREGGELGQLANAFDRMAESLEQRALERERAEQALREAEERYRAIFEQAADSIVLVDVESGAWVEFNDNAHWNLGYTREEFRQLQIKRY